MPVIDTGAKSFRWSNGSLAYSVGLIACEATVIQPSV